jgi:oligosaccharide repeat unit polymerase
MMLPLSYLIRAKVPTFVISIPGVATPPIFQYTLICLIGLTGLLVGYYIPLGARWAHRLPIWTVSWREIKIAAALLMLYGFLSFATNVAAYGGLSNYISVGYGPQRYVIQREALAFGQGLELIGIASVILMFALFKERGSRWLIIILSLVLISYVAISLLIGQRRYIIYLFLMAFVLTNYGIKPVKLRWTILTVAIVYAFFFIYAYSRGMWVQLGLAQGFVETYNIAVRNPMIVLPFAGGEFIPPAKAILEILSDSAFQFKYGSSYIVGLIRILPRVGKIWPESLRTLTEWRLATYYPGFYERGVSFNFLTIGEGYANFGYIGVFIHMAVFGFVAKFVYSYFSKYRDNVLVVLIYAIVFFIMLFEAIHGESSQVLWNASHTYVGPFVLILIAVGFLDYVAKKINVKTS